MAHVKAQKTAKGNRDSISKRLGVKVFGGEVVKPGYVIVRQRGTRFRPGIGVGLGKDFTIYAVKKGRVEFRKKMGKMYVNVV